MIINEIDNRYDRLTVLQRQETDKFGNALWLCQCDCGNTIITRGSHLRSGRTKSCGCLHREILLKIHTKPLGVSAFNHALSIMKTTAQKRNLVWNLSDEQAKELMDANCYYCGAIPANGNSERCHNIFNGVYLYNGIDRIDNTQGYVKNNVVSCCKTCNYAKRDMPLGVFKAWVGDLLKYYPRWGKK